MYKPETVCSSLCLCLRIILYCGSSGVVTALINKRCMTFDEHLHSDIHTVCYPQPGLGPYGECNVSNFQKDLSELETGVRTLCVYSNATIIPANAFSHLSNLEFLKNCGYNIRRVQSGSFSGLFNLKYLHVYFSYSGCSKGGTVA